MLARNNNHLQLLELSINLTLTKPLGIVSSSSRPISVGTTCWVYKPRQGTIREVAMWTDSKSEFLSLPL